MKKRILLMASVAAILTLLLGLVGSQVALAGFSGQYKLVNKTNSYVVQAVNSGGLWLFNLSPSGELRRLDVPRGAAYKGNTPANTVTNFWAWRSDKGEIFLGAAQIGCFDLGGDLKVTVTENGAGKPVIAFIVPNCWQTITFPVP